MVSASSARVSAGDPGTGTTGLARHCARRPQRPDLAYFYRDLLGWELATDEPDWCTIGLPDTPVNLGFQTEQHHVRPMWPGGPGDQQMQLHLDLQVTDLAGAVDDAVGLGATLAEFQPQEDVRVLLDPAGHPFCLYV